MTQSSNELDQGPAHTSGPDPATTPEVAGPTPQTAPDGAYQPVPPPPQTMPGAAAAQQSTDPADPRTSTGLNPAKWWMGAVAGAGAYVVVLLLSLVTTLLLVLGLAGSGSDESLSVPSNPFVSDGDLPSPWSILFQFAAQLPALGMMGSLSGNFDADLGMFGEVSATLSAFAMPLLITVASIAAMYWGGRFAEKRLRSSTMPDRLLQSVVAGAVFSLLVNLVATIAAIRLSAEDELTFSLNAANAASVIVAFLVGAGAAFAGRSKAVASAQRDPKKEYASSLLRDAGLTVATHFGVFLLVSILVAVIVLGVKAGWIATLSAPLWAPTAGLFMLGLGHLAALGTVYGLGDGGGLGNSNYVYGISGELAELGVPVWAGWLLFLLALVSITAAAVYWYLRRGAKDPKSVVGWVALPLAFFAAGAIALWLGGVHASFGISLGSGGAGVALAWWTPFLMMFWGLAAEVASRYLAPKVAPVLPVALVSRVQRNPSVLAYVSAGAGSVPVAAADVAGQAGTPPVNDGTGSTVAPVNAPVPVEHTPLSKKAKRNLALAGGAVGLVAVLVGGGAIAANVIRAGNGPEKAVEEFLTAMVDGNAEEAMAIADPSIPNSERVLLTNEIYQKAAARPDGFSVLETTETGDSASVTVELRQNGVKTETSYELVKSDPTFLNNNWALKGIGTGLVSVQVDPDVSTVLVNDVEVPLAGIDIEGGYAYQLPALPGNYTVGLPETSKYLSAEPATAVVSIQDTGAGKPVSLEPEPNAAFNTAVQEQYKALMKGCAAQQTLDPEGCPFSTYAFSDIRNVSWEITKEAVIKINPSYEGDSWTLSADKPGEAVASYERNTSFGKEPKWEGDTSKTQFYPRGEITIDKDQLTVKFSD